MRTSPTVSKMLIFLYDDINTVGMMGVLFDNLGKLKKDHDELCAVKGFLQQVLGLTLAPLPEKTVQMTPEIERLLQQRKQARAEKDWALADELRDELKALGIQVHDKKL
jgi:cysteinyl-tRNA synthetase